MTSLTVSIPAYNDARTLAAIVEDSLALSERLGVAVDVLVIDDGSSDETPAVCERLAAASPRVRVLRHPRNLGFGPTIRETYLLPSTDWVVFLPGDGQIPADEVIPLFRAAAGDDAPGCDLVLAVRAQRHDPWRRRFVSWCYNAMVSLVARRRIHDVNGTALVHRRLLERIALEGRSAFVHAELVLETMRAGASYREVAIAHRAREHGSGSGNRPRVIATTFRDLLRYALGRRRVVPSLQAGE
ncbi:MAG: glycosyltransferase family 2 protein [Pirellulales bacterium]|nr:glycosyltransferase family 2 protein [Pirellulales bacterium]